MMPTHLRNKLIKLYKYGAALPYGKWTCEDGREVLFNRKYTPLWEKTPKGKVIPANPEEWIPWKSQEWFYKDGSHPAVDKKTLSKCKEILKNWNITFPTL